MARNWAIDHVGDRVGWRIQSLFDYDAKPPRASTAGYRAKPP